MRIVLGCGLSGAATALLLGNCATALASDTGELGRVQQAVIYDEDDRREVYEIADEALRERARHSAVALMYSHTLVYDADAVYVQSATEDEVYGLCSGEPFRDQPAAAWCSGVLIDDDLVVTAGHCFGNSKEETEQVCPEVVFAFGYLYEEPGTLAAMTRDDVYRCRKVVAWNFDGEELAEPDYTIVQLDRAVVGQSPAPLRPEPVAQGERVNLIGFGARLPAKIDRGGTVVDTQTYAEYFGATTDTFEGASGSALFDDAGAVVGIHTRGNQDWNRGTCTSARIETSGFDEHQHVSTVLRTLCDSGWPSERLCDRAPSCGDDVCSATEDRASCAQDCASSSCGDHLCEASEVDSCNEDCNPYEAVPSDWFCPPAFYGDELGCDCQCGALDVDCGKEGQEVLGCTSGGTCGTDGRCNTPRVPPSNGVTHTSPLRNNCSLSPERPGSPREDAAWFFSLLAIAGLLRRPSAASAGRR